MVTETFTAELVVWLPARSVVRAVIEWAPAAIEVESQLTVYGELVTVLTTDPSTRNCTCLTPPLSDALACQRDRARDRGAVCGSGNRARGRGAIDPHRGRHRSRRVAQ